MSALCVPLDNQELPGPITHVDTSKAANLASPSTMQKKKSPQPQTLCLNAGTYLPIFQAKLDSFAVAAQNGPLMDMRSKSKELLLGLKVLLKEYCPAAFRIGVLVRDRNWAGRDPGSGKNAWAVLECCLLVMISLLGDEWENVEYIKTLVAALVTWQRWHSRTPGCFHTEECGEAMLSKLCARCRIWTTITSLSGLRNFCNFESDLDREEQPVVLTDGEVCDAVWAQSEKVYS